MGVSLGVWLLIGILLALLILLGASRFAAFFVRILSGQ